MSTSPHIAEATPVEVISNPIVVEAPTETVEQKVDRIAQDAGIATSTLYNLVESESSFKVDAEGDGGCSWGLVQINTCVHKITKEQATDPDFALNYAAKELKEGRETAWTVCSCVKYAKVLMKGVPRQNASEFIPNTDIDVGVLAVFRYKDGISHVAYVTKVRGDTFTVKEANYKPCLTGTRTVSIYDPALLGFWLPG